MSNEELAKILAQAAKHVVDASHLGKLEEAARKHGRPFRTHCKVERIAAPSTWLASVVSK
jgi:hypothetical protein